MSVPAGSGLFRAQDDVARGDSKPASLFASIEHRIQRCWQAVERWPVAGMVLVGVLLAIQISPFWYLERDSAAYLSMARSLADGEGFQRFGSPLLWYPPGYSVVISPTFWFGPRPFLLISALHWLLAMLCMVGIYRWARRVVPAAPLLITCFCMLNVGVCIYYRRVLTETLFLTLMIWTVETMWTASRARGLLRTVGYTAAAALLLAMLALVRQAGVTLAAGFGLLLLVEAVRHRLSWTRAVLMTLAVGVPASLAVVGLMQRESALASQLDERTYLDEFSQGLNWWQQGIEGMRQRISDAGRVTVPGMYKAYGRPQAWLNINTLVYLGVFALLAFGWLRMVRRTRDPLALAVPWYLALHVAFALDSGARYMVPMIPVLAASLWYALEPLGRRQRGMFGVLTAAHVAASLGYWAMIDLPRAREFRTELAGIEQLVEPVGDGGSVAIDEALPTPIDVALHVALDRETLSEEYGDQVDLADWLVTADGASIPPGFVRQRQWGEYRLWRRRPSTMSHANKRIGPTTLK